MGDGTLNKTKGKPTTIPRLIEWFYTEVVGITPDKTHYSRGTKILKPLVTQPKRGPTVRVYTVEELYDAVQHLLRDGVHPTDIAVLAVNDLVRSYTDEGKISDSLLSWLRNRYNPTEGRENMPSGW